jgi:5-methylcytosine-specific restriction endonuclease McrA
MHQSLQGATFHIEHVVPRVKGRHSNSNNLALACPSCNLHKADRVSSQPSSSITAVAFFNPRSEVWADHFEWDDYTLVGKTEVGRVTIQALDLNHVISTMSGASRFAKLSNCLGSSRRTPPIEIETLLAQLAKNRC